MAVCYIIDDSDLIREIAERILGELKVECRTFSSAPDAVEACAEEKPAAVFLDWDLPSMGALDFLRGAGAMDADKRPEIVLCATENDPQQFALARAAGARHHLLKPYDLKSVRAVLQAIGVLEKDATDKPAGIADIAS